MIDKLWREARESYRGAFHFWVQNDLTRTIIYLRLAIKRIEDLISLFEKELGDKNGKR